MSGRELNKCPGDKGIAMIHIAPTQLILKVQMYNSGGFMALVHLCGVGTFYEEEVTKLAKAGVYVMLDNSAFELGESCSIEELIEVGTRIGACCLILPDGDNSGIDAVKAAGFDVMTVPKGPNMVEDFNADLANPDIKLVGLSYIHANKYLGYERHDAYGRRTFLAKIDRPSKPKIHLLGCISLTEMMSISQISEGVLSQDTSMAVWSGYNRNDVTTLQGKYSPAADFSVSGCEEHQWNMIMHNIGVVKGVQHALG